MSTPNTIAGSAAPDFADTTLSLGTRASKLALVQTKLVEEAILTALPHINLVIKTREQAAGDLDKTTPFSQMTVKNIWTHDLEVLLLEDKLSLLVHSLKDVPTVMPDRCEIGANLERADPRDAFVVRSGSKYTRIQDLPKDSVIGTSSVRRTAQIALKYPHLKVKDLRGNIDTRLGKLDEEGSPFDAIILAAAGLIRINQTDRISQYLSSSDGGMLYAVGQGAIATENRTDDVKVQSVLQRINHLPTFLATSAERSLLRTIEGGCSAPLGVEADWLDDGRLKLSAIVVSVDGRASAEATVEHEVKSLDDAEALGKAVAAEILQRGGDKILAEIKAKKPTTPADLLGA